MSGKFARTSKFRHVYADIPKPDQHFLDIKNPLASGEGTYVKANTKFFAVARDGGGGPVYVHPLDKPGRFDLNAPMLAVNRGKVLDMDFHPFLPNMIATGSEDCTVAVTAFPADGLTENVVKADVVLQGHSKKVQLVQFHPTANAVVASGAYDRTIKIWNIETGEQMYDYTAPTDNIFSMAWNKDGSLLACTSKDKRIRVADPRVADDAKTMEAESFTGTKSSKVFWVPQHGWIGACGFSRTAKRQLRMWDLKNISEPIFEWDIDQASSVLNPYFDVDNGILYLAGKGDGSIQYFEIINDSRKCHMLSVHRDTTPQKGGGWVPKRALDTTRCEVARFMKLTKNSVIPISFLAPRKNAATVFQSDIYPDTYAGRPGQSADEYAAGGNVDPPLTSMDPALRGSDDSGGAVFQKKKSYQELAEENAQLRKQVAELEERLKAAAPAAAAEAEPAAEDAAAASEQ